MADNARIYVAGLPYSATEEDIKAHFAGAGTVVSVFLPTDRETGRKRGFGFVEFEAEDARDKAIAMFDQTDFGGRTIGVSAARPREERA
jgi:RNA recognition motif-containing protein